MERRYVAVQTIGNPSQLISQVSQSIKSLNLAQKMPVIKVEKKARGQFYLFLALEDMSEADMLTQAKTVLRLARISSQPLPCTLEPAQIKSMVSSADIEVESTNALTYKSYWKQETRTAFDDLSQLDVPTDFETTRNAEMSERYDKLMYWLSAVGTGSWNTFVAACETLGVIEPYMPAHRILRRLRLLGHIECADDGQRWMMRPPVLARDATNPDVSFLCGARDVRLLDDLRTHWKIEVAPQAQGASCVQVECGELEAGGTIKIDAKRSVIVAVDVARAMSRSLPHADEWLATIPNVGGFSANQYEVQQRWNAEANEYEACDEVLERDGQCVGTSGLYRFTPRDETREVTLNLFLDGERRRWLRGDWYGLRFLAMRAAHVAPRAVYDKSENALCVPVACHLPLRYERAAVLAAGKLPSRSNDYQWVRYEDVPVEVIGMLTDKLGFQVEDGECINKREAEGYV